MSNLRPFALAGVLLLTRTLQAEPLEIGGPPYSSPSETSLRYAVLDTGSDEGVTEMNNRGDFAGGNKRWFNRAYQTLSAGNEHVTAHVTDMSEDGVVAGYVTRPYPEGARDTGLRAAIWPTNSNEPSILQTPGIEPVVPAHETFTMHKARAQTIDGTIVYGMGDHVWWESASSGQEDFDSSEAGLRWDLSESFDSLATQYDDWFLAGYGDPQNSLIQVAKARGGHTLDYWYWLSEDGQDWDQGHRVDRQRVAYRPLDINKYGAHTANTSTNAGWETAGSYFLQSGNSRIPLPAGARPINARRVTNTNGIAANFFQVVGNSSIGPFMAEPEFPGSTNYVTQNLTQLAPTNWTVDYAYDINDHGVIAAAATREGAGQTTVLLVPAALAVDANRDGSIKFAGNLHDTSLSDIPLDRTSQAEPFRFWVNDDDDRNNEDHPGSGYQDLSNNIIESERDLEDFSRLHIHIGALQDQVVAGDIQVGLEWKGVTGTNLPSMKVYQAAETNGGDQYLKNVTTAQSQVGSSGSALGTITNGGSFKFPASFWQADILSGRPALTPQQPNRYLVFEGAREGKGQLAITLWKGTNKIGEGPGVWIELLDVRKMYVRGKATPESLAYPHETMENQPGVQFGFTMESSPPFVAPPSEAPQSVVFVHGINGMAETDESQNYPSWVNTAETAFKRMWHQGYKGRFGFFKWPALTPALPFLYNDSEWRAWKSGRGLAQFVNSTNFPSHYAKNLFSFSQGAVVCSAALKDYGLSVNNYVMSQGAIPAGCYDTNEVVNSYDLFAQKELQIPTPDDFNDLGYRGYLANMGVSGSVVSFYNTSDYALKSGEVAGIKIWEGNQLLSKPNSIIQSSGTIRSYSYEAGTNSVGQRCFLREIYSPYRFRQVATIYESVSFVARPRSEAVGARSSVGGRINETYPVGPDSACGFGGGSKDHGGQFSRPIQQTGAYYEKLLSVLVEE